MMQRTVSGSVLRLASVLLLALARATLAQAGEIDLREDPPAVTPVDVFADHRAILTVLSAVEDPPLKAQLTLTEFRDPQGGKIKIAFAPPDGKGRPTETLSIVLEHQRQTVALDGSELASGQAHSGELLVKVGKAAAKGFALELARKAPVVYQGAPKGMTPEEVAAPPDGITVIHFDGRPIRGLGDAVEIELGEFVNQDNGELAGVRFLVGDKPPSEKRTLGATELESGPRALRVDASGLTPGEEYHGTLTARVGSYRFESFLKLERKEIAPNAVLRVKPQAQVRKVSCWVLRCTPDAVIVTVEAEGGEPIVGLSVVAATVDATDAELIAVDDLAVTLVQGEAPEDTDPDVWGLPSNAFEHVEARSVPKRGQAKLRIQFARAFGSGEHKAKLQIRALNAKIDSLPELALTVDVRHPWPYALVVLALSVLLSYVATKGLRNSRRRTELGRRLNAVSGAFWMSRDRSGLLPIVSAKAVISLLRKLLSRKERLDWLLGVPETLEPRTERLETRLPYLQRLSSSSAYWSGSNHDEMVVRRAQKVLRGLTEGFAASPLGEDVDAVVASGLDDLEKWQDSDQLPELYWVDLKKDIRQLLWKVRPEVFDEDAKLTDPDRQQFASEIDTLSARLEKPTAIELAEKEIATIRSALSPAQDPKETEALDRLAKAFEGLDSTVSQLVKELDEARKDAATARTGPLESAEKLAKEELVEAWRAIEETNRGLAETAATGSSQQQAQLEGLTRLVGEVPRPDPARLAKDIREAGDLLRSDRQIVTDLRDELKPDEPPEGLNKAIQAEHTYAALKVIWERHGDKKRARELLGLVKHRKPTEELFDKVDKWAWQGLKEKLSFASPKGGVFEAFSLIRFELAPEGPGLGENYLFKHGLLYEWEIDFGGAAPLRPATREPRVTQFIPLDGATVKPRVTVRFEKLDDSFEVQGADCTTVRSREFSAAGAFRRVELVALAIAMVIAVATGLKSEVVEGTFRGSLANYLTLFLWGFLADQTKNLLQNLGTYMGRE